MSSKISKEAIPQIVRMYTVEMIPMIKIAEIFNVTRTAIHKLIRKTGTPTQKGIASRRIIECHNCHKKFEITRARSRELGNNRAFCERSCYTAWLQRNGSIDNRGGRRTGREIIESIYGVIPDGACVHHIDGNQNNNNISNLLLLKDQADHIRLHRETDPNIIPLFVGADVVLPSSSAKFSFYNAANRVLKYFNQQTIPIPRDLSMLQLIQFLLSTLKKFQTVGDIQSAIIRNFGKSRQLDDIFKDSNNYIAF